MKEQFSNLLETIFVPTNYFLITYSQRLDALVQQMTQRPSEKFPAPVPNWKLLDIGKADSIP
jgi:hypothetical protein